jgi:diguanylate cyclase (GGDEF)-like protein
LLLDLDRFNLVNDRLGHAVGDEFLVAVADRLTGLVRPSDCVARCGGDEFDVRLERPDGAELTLSFAERLLAALTVSFVLDGHEVVVTPSIGLAFKTSTQTDANELMRRADLALFREGGGARDLRRL